MTNNKRPKLDIPYSTAEKLLEVVSVASVLMIFIYLQVHYDTLPDLVPMHLSFDGRVTRMEDKVNLYFLPFLNFFLYGLLTFLARRPERFNYPVTITDENAFYQYRNARTYVSVAKALVTTFLCIFFVMILGEPRDVGARVPYVGMILAVLLLSTLATSIFFVAKSLRRS